jgi:hypothetical protein
MRDSQCHHAMADVVPCLFFYRAGQWYVSFSSRACDLFLQEGNPSMTYNVTLGAGVSTLLLTSLVAVLLMF